MRSRLTPAAMCLIAFGTLVSGPVRPAFSQLSNRPLIDGYTVGIGLALYQGDLDRNPGNNPAQFLASGGLHAMAGVDRGLAGGRLGVELHYNRLAAESAAVSGHHNVISIDLTFGRALFTPAVLLYAGVAPAVVLSTYSRQSVAAEALGLANEGAGFDIMIPIGVVLQDRVRLGTRLAIRDRVDGTDVLGGRDLLSNITIAYRFTTSR